MFTPLSIVTPIKIKVNYLKLIIAKMIIRKIVYLRYFVFEGRAYNDTNTIKFYNRVSVKKIKHKQLKCCHNYNVFACREYGYEQYNIWFVVN